MKVEAGKCSPSPKDGSEQADWRWVPGKQSKNA